MKTLRVLSAHRAQLDSCAYCPKLCRTVCPVSETTRREALTPWGKMSYAFLVERQARLPDAALAGSAYACSGCGRCQSFCRHQVDVPDTLSAARNVAVASGFAPPGIQELLRRFREHGSPVGDLEAAREACGAEVASPSQGETFFPGCVALAREPYDVRAAQAVGRELSARLPLARASDRCCGYPLWAAGDREGFAAHARRVAARLSGAGRLVVGDPGCAHTFRHLYPAFGVEVALEIVPLAEELAVAVARAGDHRKLRERIAYHDPCHLARSLGCTEPPRRLLTRVAEELVLPAHAGLDTICAGAGGAMPWSLPAESEAMAKARAAELTEAAPSVVTACPTAKRALSRAGLRVRDLAAVTAAWLELSAVED
ncbi:MAG: (Fe-S)-binding protein [Myxococcales bacterium]